MQVVKGKYTQAEIFTDNLEQSAFSQIQTVCNYEVFKDIPIKVMPDCHAGAGCVIGFTMPLKDFVVPNLVGVDIGCGLSSYQFSFITGRHYKSIIDFAEFDKYLRDHVPSGYSTHAKMQTRLSSDFHKKLIDIGNKVGIQQDRLLNSIGTLGGGNHFIELGMDTYDTFWITVHSGSRNFGLRVAQYHQDIAKKQCPEGPRDLAYLTGKDKESYLADMKIAQEYASINRSAMLRILFEYFRELGAVKLREMETTHNYISFQDNILRKGAISAQNKEDVLIPFNMRDGIILGRGKGNPDWNYSAPHGAGRVLARGEAKRQLNLAEFEETMGEVWSSCVGKDTLDESPMAYKPKEEILKHLGDTLDVIDFIKPLYNFKASGE